jgi:hypothetical protein
MNRPVARPGAYVRTKRTTLKNLVSRATGNYTQGGRPKNRERRQPSMPKLKCLEEPTPE